MSATRGAVHANEWTLHDLRAMVNDLRDERSLNARLTARVAELEDERDTANTQLRTLYAEIDLPRLHRIATARDDAQHPHRVHWGESVAKLVPILLDEYEARVAALTEALRKVREWLNEGWHGHVRAGDKILPCKLDGDLCWVRRMIAAVLAATREQCAKIAEREPELEGPAPPEVVRTFDCYTAEEHLRAAVRATKRSIAKAIRAGADALDREG